MVSYACIVGTTHSGCYVGDGVLHTDTYLHGWEGFLYLWEHLLERQLGYQPAQNLTHCNGSHTVILLFEGKETRREEEVGECCR